jgi:hypothetical protein
MTDRIRLGMPPRRTIGAMASWLVGIFVAAVLVRSMITGSLAVSGGVAGLLVLALWAALWWRYRQRGVYVSTSRVWLCRVFGTHSVDLGSLTGIDTVPAGPDGVRQLVLDHQDGRRIPAPLRGYAMGHDDPSGPLDVLPALLFDQLLTDLQRRVDAAERE